MASIALYTWLTPKMLVFVAKCLCHFHFLLFLLCGKHAALIFQKTCENAKIWLLRIIYREKGTKKL